MRPLSYFKNVNSRRLARRDYYEEKKKKGWLLFLIFFLVIVGALVYFFVFSKYCQINNLVINIKDYDTLRLPRQEIEQLARGVADKKYLFFIPANSLVIFPQKELAKKLKEDKRISLFKIRKIAPDILEINIEVFEPKAVLTNFDNQKYLLNEEGNMIALSTNPTVLLPIIDNKVAEINSFAPEVYFMDKINKNFDFKINQISIYQEKGVVATSATTSEGWDIKFDASGDLDQQIKNLLLIIRDSIKDRTGLGYIDLRFGNKIFYKPYK